MTAVQVTNDIITAAQGGDGDAMWEIVSAYDGVIRHLVRKVAPAASRDDAEDLLQEARATLIQHVRDYNTSTSTASLTTYAHHALKRAIAKAWVEATTSLSVDSSTALTVRRALWQTEGDVEGAWMIVGSNDDPRRRMSRELFTATVEALAGTKSLDSPREERRGTLDYAGYDTLASSIPDPTSDFTNPTERRDLARYLLCEIPQRQSLALRAYYGINMAATPDADIAADMGIRPAALRKLRSNGLDSARKVAASQDLAA
ncbi:sigma-70 family RNA polymerase sigma factor [Streptomyces sp. NPDC091212]|uniref:sigma-70 family RNA polymerase sigma factor n=1 Tax=Streptomyces sp. NPDC091212 TaxID=3155191 RepID=UPI00342B1AB5